MLNVSVNRRHLLVFTAVIALFVSVAWVGAASRVSAGSSTPVVYVATGENFPDALGAGPAAATVNGPILLVAQNAIPGETAAELTRLAPDKIIVVGGTAVVSVSVENGLKAYAGTVERIAGSNRYDTAAKLSAVTFPVTPTSSVSGDADTLDGKDSTAFSLSGHDHDADYLAKNGKAVDADTLDGMDSGAFAPTGHNHDGSYLEYGDIVMAVSGSNWRTFGNATAPVVDSYGSYVFVTGDGFIELGLDAPVMVGTTDYRLGSVEVCFELASGGAYIDQTAVMVASIGANQQLIASDGTDRVASGCHTLDVSASTPNGASVRLQISGGGWVNVYGVRALWEPTP